jgi:catalase
VVHAVGTGAHGHLEVTSPDVSRCSPRPASAPRCSSASPWWPARADTARDPRGLAPRVHAEDGTGDLVGNTTPIFFPRDGIKFPGRHPLAAVRSVHHAWARDPCTNHPHCGGRAPSGAPGPQ